MNTSLPRTDLAWYPPVIYRNRRETGCLTHSGLWKQSQLMGRPSRRHSGALIDQPAPRRQHCPVGRRSALLLLPMAALWLAIPGDTILAQILDLTSNIQGQSHPGETWFVPGLDFGGVVGGPPGLGLPDLPFELRMVRLAPDPPSHGKKVTVEIDKRGSTYEGLGPSVGLSGSCWTAQLAASEATSG